MKRYESDPAKALERNLKWLEDYSKRQEKTPELKEAAERISDGVAHLRDSLEKIKKLEAEK